MASNRTGTDGSGAPEHEPEPQVFELEFYTLSIDNEDPTMIDSTMDLVNAVNAEIAEVIRAFFSDSSDYAQTMRPP